MADWRSRRALACEALIAEELGEDETGAFLVWGDPGVYDSTLAIVEEILDRGNVTFDYEVIPGISAVAALTARHRTSLTQVGRPVHLTTGRRLAEDGPTADDTVVMLDAHSSFVGLDDHAIYWGAYLGTSDEILVSGKVSEVGDRIREIRAEARARKLDHGHLSPAPIGPVTSSEKLRTSSRLGAYLRVHITPAGVLHPSRNDSVLLRSPRWSPGTPRSLTSRQSHRRGQLFRVHEQFQDGRPAGLPRPVESIGEVRGRAHPLAVSAEGLRERREIRVPQVGAGHRPGKRRSWCIRMVP